MIWLTANTVKAIEIEWANQLRPNDLKTLKQFKNSVILQKLPQSGIIDDINVFPVYQFLNDLQ